MRGEVARDSDRGRRRRLETLRQVLEARLEHLDREKLKDFLFTICERVTLDAETLTARIHYKIPLTRRNRVASPRRLSEIPKLAVCGIVAVAV